MSTVSRGARPAEGASPRWDSRVGNRAPGRGLPLHYAGGVTRPGSRKPAHNPPRQWCTVRGSRTGGWSTRSPRRHGRARSRRSAAAGRAPRLAAQSTPQGGTADKTHWGHNRVAGALRQNSTGALAARWGDGVVSGGGGVSSYGPQPHRGGVQAGAATSRQRPTPHPAERVGFGGTHGGDSMPPRAGGCLHTRADKTTSSRKGFPEVMKIHGVPIVYLESIVLADVVVCMQTFRQVRRPLPPSGPHRWGPDPSSAAPSARWRGPLTAGLDHCSAGWASLTHPQPGAGASAGAHRRHGLARRTRLPPGRRAPRRGHAPSASLQCCRPLERDVLGAAATSGPRGSPR